MIYSACHGIPYNHSLWRIIRSSTIFRMDPRYDKLALCIKCQTVAKVEFIEIYISLKRASFLTFHITSLTKIILVFQTLSIEIILVFHILSSYDPRLSDIMHAHKYRMEEFV